MNSEITHYAIRTPLRAKFLATLYFCRICSMKEIVLYGFKKRTAKIFLEELLQQKMVTKTVQLYKITPLGNSVIQHIIHLPYITVWLAKISAEQALQKCKKPIIKNEETN